MSSASTSAARAPEGTRLPLWITIRPPAGPLYSDVRGAVADLGLGTVCQEAHCPNLAECWSAGTATIMLLGTECTRRCGFCAVTTHWPAGATDGSEPGRVAEAVRRWKLRYVVLTQVCRDDLKDGGATIISETVRRIRSTSPGTKVELLIGDLQDDEDALRTVLRDPPDVLAHNLETVRRTTPTIRDRRASYDRSLAVLRDAKRLGPTGLVSKSSIMLGVGERNDEILDAFRDLRAERVDLLTLGQYLRPSERHVAVDRYPTPAEFAELKRSALAMGFAGVEAGPLVRSSYHAEELFELARRTGGV